MSALYEIWKPAVGDRVRITLRDEEGTVMDGGQTGTVVEVHRGTPEALCVVEYDGQEGAKQDSSRQRHRAVELEPIDETKARVDRDLQASSAEDDADWQPTVGDWVAVASNSRRGVIQAIDERGGETFCEVEYDHLPGQTAEPQRGTHALRDLEPTREPSAEAIGR
jgi:hypothetical protein